MDQTGQPYAYVDDEPVGNIDPNGLLGIPGTSITINVPSPTRLLHNLEGIGEAAWRGLGDIGTAAANFYQEHPVLVGAVLTVTVCASTGGLGCTVVAYLAVTGNIAVSAQELRAGQISTSQFLAESGASLLLVGGTKALPLLLEKAGLGTYAFYAFVGEEFSGKYRALTELGAAGIDELASLAVRISKTSNCYSSGA